MDSHSKISAFRDDSLGNDDTVGLAEKIKNILNFEGSLVFNNDIPYGNPRKLLDSSLINSYGWSPTTDLDTGLDNTFNWYLQNS